MRAFIEEHEREVLLILISMLAVTRWWIPPVWGFDLFLVITTFLCMTLLTLKRFLWLIPALMLAAMFIHESFMVLWAPTIVAALIVVYMSDGKEKKILATLVSSIIAVAGAFLAL